MNEFVRAIIFFFMGLFIFPAPAFATWSVVILDKETKTIGIAGASCSYIVYGIGEAVPGQGAVIAQAASNMKAKQTALEMIARAQSHGEIIKTITDPAFDPAFALQQYAVVTFAEFDTPKTFSGDKIPEVRGTFRAPGISVQGNTLANEDVLQSAFAAAQELGSLPDRLMAALSEGANAGGDVRCGDQRATSAFITIIKADDFVPIVKDEEVIPERYLNLVVFGLDRGGDNAVENLREIYLKWKNKNNDTENTKIVCRQKMPGQPESYACE